ncbi:MAG: diguanylate cyclase [Comamonadaceae bacterium]|nr:MAG: diguanylate cyclase [Comamonadaceae bacterium]
MGNRTQGSGLILLRAGRRARGPMAASSPGAAMNALELVIWSMALGGIGAVTLARGVDLLARPAASRLRAVSYHLSVFVLVLVLSGVLRHANPPGADRLQVMQVLAGPLCVGLSNFWISGWLRASQRDRLMAAGLGGSALLLPVLAVLALWLPREQQLPAAAAISVLGGALTFWLTLRGWLMGDRMALVMATGCLLTLPAIAGLYAMAMQVAELGIGTQALLAFSATISNGVTGLVLWRRDRHEWRAQHKDTRLGTVDPVTRLHSGAELVRKLLRAQRRRSRTGREGALLAVIVFDVERIATHVGSAGVNDMWLALAARLQRQVGVVNPVGRYWDRCFVVLVETIPSRGALRTLGLRVATSLRQPLEVIGLAGEPMQVHLDLGVGVVHLPTAGAPVEDILDEAQELAASARHMRSRAAIYDPACRGVVPVEQAELGPRERGWEHPAAHVR